MTREEAQREFEELMRTPIGPAKPKVPVVSVPVTEQFAEVVAANPESVRVVARREDGVSVLARPEDNPLVRVRVDLVREVDACGRPVWPKGGAVHEYNPLDALK
jgi:hypothetical protein